MNEQHTPDNSPELDAVAARLDDLARRTRDEASPDLEDRISLRTSTLINDDAPAVVGRIRPSARVIALAAFLAIAVLAAGVITWSSRTPTPNPTQPPTASTAPTEAEFEQFAASFDAWLEDVEASPNESVSEVESLLVAVEDDYDSFWSDDLRLEKEAL